MVTAIIAGLATLLGILIACGSQALNYWFFSLMYGIGSIMMKFINFFQALMRKLCGLPINGDTTNYNAFDNDSDLALMLLKNRAVQNAFIAMFIMAFLLIFIFMIVQIIRVEYTTEGDKNSKGNIIQNGLKAMMYFIITPTVVLLGMVASSFILRAVDIATSSASTQISSQIFYASAYDANYYRINKGRNPEDYDKILEGTDFSDLINFGQRLSPAADESMANRIDEAFMGGTKSNVTPVANIDGFYYETTACSIFDTKAVASYYNICKINYVLLFFTAGTVLGCLISCSFGLIARAFNVVTLFIISPAIIGMMPLDSGKAFGSWKSKFIGNVLSAYGPVVAVNLYFIIMAIVQNIEIFSATDFATGSFLVIAGWSAPVVNKVLQCIFIIAGAVMIKDSSKLIAGFVGAEDALGVGEGLKKSVTEKAKATMGTAMAGAGLVVTGAGLAAKLGKGVGWGVNKIADKAGFTPGMRHLTSDERKKIDLAKDADGNKISFNNRREKFDYLRANNLLSKDNTDSLNKRFKNSWLGTHLSDNLTMAGARIQRYGAAGFASTGFAKTMNDLTLGSFKFFGGKGYQQYDKEIMGRSDNWESFVRGVTKPEKDRREDRRDATIIASVKRKSEAEAEKATANALAGINAQINQSKDIIKQAQDHMTDAITDYNSAIATNNQHAISEASRVLTQFANTLISSTNNKLLKQNLGGLIDQMQKGGAVTPVVVSGQTFESKLDVDFKSIPGGESAVKKAVKDAVASSYNGVKLDTDKMEKVLKNTLKNDNIAGQVTSAIKSNLEAMQKELADIKAWKRRMG